MAETYCGKSCEDCTKKEQLNCSGCKTGPGRQFGGDCELAKCIRSKGHETCDTCGFKSNCGTLRSRDSMPDYRIRKIEDEEQRKAAIAKRAPVLGKWLWIIFWLIIPSTIGGLMANETTVEILPGLFTPGQIIDAICALTYGAILMKLGSEEDKYRTSGICALIAGVSVPLQQLSMQPLTVLPGSSSLRSLRPSLAWLVSTMSIWLILLF